MRFRIEASDRDPYWFIGNPAQNERTEMSAALDERVQITRNQQTVPGAEFEGVLVRDRKNQRLVFTATVKRTFESDWDREDFLMRLAALGPGEQEHRWQGDVWVRRDKMGTTEFKEWKLADAVIGISGTDYLGECGLKITYTITAGGYSGQTRSGTSQLALLTGSSAPLYGMKMSIVDLDALMLSHTNGFTDFFIFRVTIQYAGGGAYTSYGKNLVPSGDTPGFDEYELPLAVCGGALATDFESTFGPFSLLDFTVGVGLFNVLTTYVTAFDFIVVEIFHYYTDGYGSHTELIHTQTGTLLQDHFRLIGTVASTPKQLVGLVES